MHANAISDPIFAAHFGKLPAKDKEYCMTCHAPFARHLSDPALEKALSREGVSCDFCHRVVGGEPGTGKFITDFTGPRRGPHKDALDKFHPVAYSEFHTKAEFCGVCHEAVNANGVAVLNTYEEWKQGPYPAAGVTCQKCHMPEDINQDAVQLKEVSGRHTLISHTFLGGHSQIRLAEAASLSLVTAWRNGDIEASVFVTNKESGHPLPTGIPSRRVVMSVTLFDSAGKALAGLNRTYQRTLKDSQGLRIPDSEVARMFLESAGVYEDNRVRPMETRRENFIFPKPPRELGEAYAMEATLTYYLPLPFGDPPEIRVEMARQKVLLRRPSVWGSVLVVANIIVLILLIATLFFIQRNRRGSENGRK
jgi:hypothetical protein